MVNDVKEETLQYRYERLISASEQTLALAKMSGNNVLTEMHLRFRITSSDDHAVHRLRDLLNVQYSSALTRSYRFDLWILDCATDPAFNDKDECQLMNWVREMIEFTNSRHCHFSEWSLVKTVTGEEYSTFAFT